jgi:hypothetical protein
MSPSLTNYKCPLFVVDVVVGMRTEAKLCSLGRSVSAHPNERRSDLLLGNRCPHSLVGLAPRMVFFAFLTTTGRALRGSRAEAFWGCFFSSVKAIASPRRQHLTTPPYSPSSGLGRSASCRLPWVPSKSPTRRRLCPNAFRRLHLQGQRGLSVRTEEPTDARFVTDTTDKGALAALGDS